MIYKIQREKQKKKKTRTHTHTKLKGACSLFPIKKNQKINKLKAGKGLRDDKVELLGTGKVADAGMRDVGWLVSRYHVVPDTHFLLFAAPPPPPVLLLPMETLTSFSIPFLFYFYFFGSRFVSLLLSLPQLF